jgi:ribosomal protein S18 acetylase RimI-like enzyme
MPSPTFRIESARTEEDIVIARTLFREYEAAIPIELDFQGFEAELASLPGKYVPPVGELLIARDDQGQPIGCVAVRPLPEDGVCEMKRLYVAPFGRGVGLGRALVEAILEAAARLGYREIRLDTLPTMTDAIRLYERLGFGPIAPYNESPIKVVYLGRKLP